MAFMELIQNNPRISLILISVIASFFVTVVRYFMLDKEKMKEIKQRRKDLRQEMKKYKDNPEKIMELNKRMMRDLPEELKHSFKPLIVTLIPFLILFAWLRSTYAVTDIAATWFWWYFGSALISSIILNKLFGLQ